MSLREILQKIADRRPPFLLCDASGDWEASDLLTRLSEPALMRSAHFQPGLYIAEIDQKGYLGRVLFKIKPIDRPTG